MVREQIALKRRNEIQPSEYFYYDLDDPDMPWEEKLTFLGWTRVRKLWHVLNPSRYHFFFKNKLAFKRIFAPLGFPVARLYAVYDPVWGRTETGRPFRTAADIAAWAEREAVADPVFKPMESAEGRMVLVMKGRDPEAPSRFLHVTGTPYGPEEIAAYLNDPALLREAYPEYSVPPRTFLVEERLRPHPALREFCRETLCCARLLTLATPDGRVEIVEASMKIQPDDCGADNVAQGAVAVGVDKETGALKEGLVKGDPPTARRTHLPGSNVTFTGRRLPHWQEARELALAAARVFPYAAAIGWDIAYTDSGLYLVEGNSSWGEWQAENREGLYKGAFKDTVEALETQRKPRKEY
jgi:hypothetical protein